MSLDVLRSGGNRTQLGIPTTSGLNSITAGVTLAAGGFDVTQGGLQTHGFYPQTEANSVVVTNGSTIPAIAGVMLISAAAARTDLVMGTPSPNKTGTTIKLVNRSSFNHEFDTEGTSLVASGGNQRLISFTSMDLTWVAADNRWYPDASK